jgi:hypothetical protein
LDIGAIPQDNIANYFTYRQKHMIYPYDVKYSFDGTNRETCACERGIMATASKYRLRGGIIGRYVRIQLRGTNSLTLAEVQVWGRDTANITSALDRGIPSGSLTRTGASPASFLVRVSSQK